MPIRPIDIVTMAPKTQEATQYKHAENQKPFNDQVNISAQLASTIQHNSKQTVKTTNNEDYEYKYDAKEKGNNSEYRQNKKKREEKEKDLKNDKHKIKTSNFDVTI